MRRFYNTDQRSLMGIWCLYKLNGIYYDCQIIHVPTEVENIFKIRPVYAIEDIGKGQGMDIELTEEEFKDKSIVRKPFIL